MLNTGVRAHYIINYYAVRYMIEQHQGMIINQSFWTAQLNDRGVADGMAKAVTNKMTETRRMN